MGVLFAFILDARFEPFLEKMPDQVWAFRFFTLSLRSGDVLGRVTSSVGVSTTGGSAVVMGSSLSALGVGVGDEWLEWLNQKCFFLVGGLPDPATAGDPEAESGLFGRLIIDMDLSALADSEKRSIAGSAVLGRSNGSSTSI